MSGFSLRLDIGVKRTFVTIVGDFFLKTFTGISNSTFTLFFNLLIIGKIGGGLVFLKSFPITIFFPSNPNDRLCKPWWLTGLPTSGQWDIPVKCAL